MKKITGIILLVGCCVSILVCLYGLFELYNDLNRYEDEYSKALQPPIIDEKFLRHFFDTKVAPKRADATFDDWLNKIKVNDVYKRGMYEQYVESLQPNSNYEDWNSKTFGVIPPDVILLKESNLQSTKKIMFLVGLSIIPFALGIYYVIATRFGSTKPTVIKQLEKENILIRKQIEKRELLIKLEKLERR